MPSLLDPGPLGPAALSACMSLSAPPRGTGTAEMSSVLSLVDEQNYSFFTENRVSGMQLKRDTFSPSAGLSTGK